MVKKYGQGFPVRIFLPHVFRDLGVIRGTVGNGGIHRGLGMLALGKLLILRRRGHRRGRLGGAFRLIRVQYPVLAAVVLHIAVMLGTTEGFTVEEGFGSSRRIPQPISPVRLSATARINAIIFIGIFLPKSKLRWIVWSMWEKIIPKCKNGISAKKRICR